MLKEDGERSGCSPSMRQDAYNVKKRERVLTLAGLDCRSSEDVCT